MFFGGIIFIQKEGLAHKTPLKKCKKEKKALIIKGLRRVGKTYIVKAFVASLVLWQALLN